MGFDPEQETPDGLHSMQYAAHLCENMLGWPANKSNLELVSSCIDAIAKKFRRTPRRAFHFLQVKVKLAEEQGETVDSFWFREGKYMLIKPRDGERIGGHKPISSADWEAAQKDRAGFFQGPEYQQFLERMKAKGL
jgi:hypothetical protein